VRPKVNPLDPQKGQWGRLPSRNGWVLSAEVNEVDEDWYAIRLVVEPAPRSHKRLTGKVVFHLHDSFNDPVRSKKPLKNGKVMLDVWAYGAFTVGAMVEQDDTPLELDLSELEGAPKRFREQ